MPQKEYIFKGTKDELIDFLFNELKINAFKPKFGDVGKFELTPINEQIEQIYENSPKIGKIYFTEEYFVDLEDDTEGTGFDICHVNVEIIEN